MVCEGGKGSRDWAVKGRREERIGGVCVCGCVFLSVLLLSIFFWEGEGGEDGMLQERR